MCQQRHEEGVSRLILLLLRGDDCPPNMAMSDRRHDTTRSLLGIARGCPASVLMRWEEAMPRFVTWPPSNRKVGPNAQSSQLVPTRWTHLGRCERAAFAFLGEQARGLHTRILARVAPK